MKKSIFFPSNEVYKVDVNFVFFHKYRKYEQMRNFVYIKKNVSGESM